ncbi:MAG: CDP-alcohol phosphatidyltransferase family protein [Bacteroidales bacterium]|jgi:CDP-diacylglycerol--serine O-phosphatidyltransferase|nr:CDP-alcohol phosphatidyltransferase family protein [Bacteroidales bacterium]
MKKHIPNFITLLNLASGSLALFMVLNDHFMWALGLLLAAAVFDFLDGFIARLLKSSSDVGKQLDSLADMVSFGLVPGAMIFMLVHSLVLPEPDDNFNELGLISKLLLGSTLMVPLFSALRLAKFNVQKDTSDFIGLPTPAFAVFWAGIYYDLNINSSFFGQEPNAWFYWSIMVVMTLFLVVPIPMLSLKFINYKFSPNIFRYLLLFFSAVILIFTGIQGLPLVVLTYILLSLVRIVIT